MLNRMLVCLIVIQTLLSCTKRADAEQHPGELVEKIAVETKDSVLARAAETIHYPFSRTHSFERLKTKVLNGEDLVIHLFVPLCDNENQGIVPVPRALGNGMDTRNNLYWGAKYGVANFFPEIAGWAALETIVNPNENVLERRVFRTKNKLGNQVYLLADAYRGDRMQACLDDFFTSVSGRKNTGVKIADQEVAAYGGADLVAFSGHNGLMDTAVDPVSSVDSLHREVVVLGCISQPYFDGPLMKSGGYPLLTTTNLMAPEAYTSAAVFTAWSNLASGEELRQAAGVAYDKYQKCGVGGATKLFASGWGPAISGGE